jgi:putative transposase
MTSTTTKPDSSQPAAEMAVDLFDNWFDPIETEVRTRAREFIEEMIRGELDTALARPRYSRSRMAGNEGRTGIAGHRHGSRTRSLTGTFGPIEIAVPRARLNTLEGKSNFTAINLLRPDRPPRPWRHRGRAENREARASVFADPEARSAT